jgi:nicotinamide-nucleotide amidase
MNAEIVAVGSEMLTPQRTDTNSLYLTDQLNSLGVEVVQKCIVGDDRDRLAEAVRAAVSRSEVVIVTGGLGPTEDDVTRDAVAAALGRSMNFDEAIGAWLVERFRRYNRPMAAINNRQAMVIEDAEVLPNDRGSAPGQWIETGKAVVILLPGPPKEVVAMWEQQCMRRLQQRLPALYIRTRFYRVAGLTESEVDEAIAPVYTQYTNPACTILAAASDIQVHLRARCATVEHAEQLLEEVGSRIQSALGDRLYTQTGDSLEACVGAALVESGQTLCVAESCTGGMLAERLTSVAGSSRYFAGGLVAYSEKLKSQLLGVDAALIEREGAVSDAVARAMAAGARDRLGTDYALSVTGVAGPGGGTEKTPVGTVFIGLAAPDGIHSKNYRWIADRDRVRTIAVNTALDLLRVKLLRGNSAQS